MQHQCLLYIDSVDDKQESFVRCMRKSESQKKVVIGCLWERPVCNVHNVGLVNNPFRGPEEGRKCRCCDIQVVMPHGASFLPLVAKRPRPVPSRPGRLQVPADCPTNDRRAQLWYYAVKLPIRGVTVRASWMFVGDRGTMRFR